MDSKLPVKLVNNGKMKREYTIEDKKGRRIDVSEDVKKEDVSSETEMEIRQTSLKTEKEIQFQDLEASKFWKIKVEEKKNKHMNRMNNYNGEKKCFEISTLNFSGGENKTINPKKNKNIAIDQMGMFSSQQERPI